MTGIRFDSIPDELKAIPSWVLWKLEPGKDGRITKVPYNARSGGKASSSNPKTWADYDLAVREYNSGGYTGIGFELSSDTGIVCIDLDDKEDTGKMNTFLDIAREFNSFTEISYSGLGLHVWCLGKKPGSKCRRKDLEIYEKDRFIAVTGNQIEGSPNTLNGAQEAINKYYELVSDGPKEEKKPSPQISTEERGDVSLTEVMRRCRTNPKFERLYCGDISGYPSASEAVLGLSNIISWASIRDPQMIDLIVRQSKLYTDEWDRTRQYTIPKALEIVEVYDPNKKKPQTDESTGLSFDVRTSTPPGTISPLIQILTSEPPEDQKEKALTGLCLKNDPPVLFVRSGEIVRIIRDEHDYPSLEGLHEIALRTRLYDCVEFVTAKGAKVRPPIDCIRDIIHGREWVGRFPHITGIVDVPLIHPDGGIVSEPGYDEQTGLYYAPSPGLTIPPIPLYPTREEIQTAVKTIWEPFRQFRFVDKPDGTHVLAGLISIVCRNLVSGSVPMLLIDKPTPGTGASLISQVLGIISEGRDPQILTAPSTEEEWKKSILSQLITGRPSIIVDNLEKTLKSPSLAALLTTQEYCDRKLGTNETITLPHRLVWIGNGNNCLLGGDLPRRCYWSRMDAESVRPWTDDKTFDHPDLRQWVSDNRGEILASVLTLARAWIQAGKPKPDTTVPKMGGFEQWRNVIGGILESAGIPGFLGNSQKMYELSDTEVPQWDRFVEAWHENLKEQSVTTREVHNSVIMCQSFQDALPDQFIDCCEKVGTFTRMLGTALSKRKDRRYPSGYKIVHDGEFRRAVKWKVIKIESQTTFTE